MSELKVYVPQDGPYGLVPEEGGEPVEEETCYLKSEADKVIAELEESHKKEVGQLLIETKRLENLCASYRNDCDNLAIREANALKEIGRDNRVIRHQKYKRCLAMAEWCEATALWSYQAANTLPVGFHATLYGKPVMIEPGRLFKRYVLLTKWHKRWLELADKFKDK